MAIGWYGSGCASVLWRGETRGIPCAVDCDDCEDIDDFYDEEEAIVRINPVRLRRGYLLPGEPLYVLTGR
jgi:hypothetical protein